ncbi:hypothetical protein GRJ2_000296100 [Grus japonensis]|uniref:Uncharacterized protein n=1 Tax=Grus japonensis TaxID=30415 RepID=A0ABC9VYN1_GRUJA
MDVMEKELGRGLGTRGEQGVETEQSKLQNGEMETFNEDKRAIGKAAIGTRRGAKQISLGKMRLGRKSNPRLKSSISPSTSSVCEAQQKNVGFSIKFPNNLMSDHSITLIGKDLCFTSQF